MEIFHPDVIYINYTVRNTPDRQSGLLSNAWELKQTIFEHEERIKIFRAGDEMDFDIDHYMFGFTLNLCKFVKGISTNLILKTIAADYFRALSANYSCPMMKGTKVTLTDAVIMDTFLPPIPEETRFRLENNVFSKLEGQKKFKKIYKFDLYVRVKK